MISMKNNIELRTVWCRYVWQCCSMDMNVEKIYSMQFYW